MLPRASALGRRSGLKGISGSLACTRPPRVEYSLADSARPSCRYCTDFTRGLRSMRPAGDPRTAMPQAMNAGRHPAGTGFRLRHVRFLRPSRRLPRRRRRRSGTKPGRRRACWPARPSPLARSGTARGMRFRPSPCIRLRAPESRASSFTLHAYYRCVLIEGAIPRPSQTHQGTARSDRKATRQAAGSRAGPIRRRVQRRARSAA